MFLKNLDFIQNDKNYDRMLRIYLRNRVVNNLKYIFLICKIRKFVMQLLGTVKSGNLQNKNSKEIQQRYHDIMKDVKNWINDTG